MWSRVSKKIRVLMAASALGAFVPVCSVDTALERIVHPPRKAVPHVASIAGSPVRLVSLRTRDGLLIRAWYVVPRNGATILLAHGHGENRAQMLPEAELLVEHGYGVFAFDWRAHGGSDGDESTRGDKERWDLDAALAFLSGDPDARSGVIGALGFSRGGNVLVEVAPLEPRIKAVVAEAVASSAVESLRQDVGAWKMPFVLWALERRGMDVRARGPTIGGCDRPMPILVLAGAEDRSRRGTERFFEEACEPKELWVVAGTAHGGYAAVAGAEYERRIVGFFDRWLLANEKARR